ncbi:hypothetical protein ABPG73_008951, partial [Tetrahymena malaccensis]
MIQQKQYFGNIKEFVSSSLSSHKDITINCPSQISYDEVQELCSALPKCSDLINLVLHLGFVFRIIFLFISKSFFQKCQYQHFRHKKNISDFIQNLFQCLVNCHNLQSLLVFL